MLSPPLRSSIDFVRASIAAFQSPVRYWATPSVFQLPPSFGASSTALLASSTARSRVAELGLRACGQQPGQVVVGTGEVGLEPDRLAVFRDRRVELALLAQGDAEVGVGFGVGRA